MLMRVDKNEIYNFWSIFFFFFQAFRPCFVVSLKFYEIFKFPERPKDKIL